jgi:hypothetical protein
MKLSFSTLLLCLFLIANGSLAQTGILKPTVQDSLGKLSANIWKQKTDEARIAASDTFFIRFRMALENNELALLAYDSLPGITRAVSDDGFVRIFTWNVPVSNGKNKYWGIIQLLYDSSEIVPLTFINDAESAIMTGKYTPLTWYGALYYKIIDVEIENKKVYTLLGWDGFTNEANRKLIDVLSMDASGNLTFGMPVFKTDQGIKSRIVFEYAEKATMLLRYDYQAINIEKRKKIKKENTWLIVMDRLVPMDPSLKNMRKYYVPSGDTYDGYIFRNGYWILVEEIEVANKKKDAL